jgi:hypothetical protein
MVNKTFLCVTDVLLCKLLLVWDENSAPMLVVLDLAIQASKTNPNMYIAAFKAHASRTLACDSLLLVCQFF